MPKKRSSMDGKNEKNGKKAKPAVRRKPEPEREPGPVVESLPSEPLQAEHKPVPQLQGPEFYARVARKAYDLFERRGREPGHDVEDWLEAERLVKEEMQHEAEGSRV